MLLSCRSLARRLRRSLTPSRAALLLVLLLVVDSLLLLADRPPATNAHEPRAAAPSSHGAVFIAGMHTDTAPLLHRSWASSLADLARRLGPANVYVSLVEVGSSDATRSELRQLQRRLEALGVTVTLQTGPAGWELAREAAHKPPRGQRRPGWVWHHGGERVDMRRAPLQARSRNRAMEPLMALAAEGKVFERVLWIDDVVFTAQDALDLLGTRDGEYAAACSVDTGDSIRLGDASALRDDRGQALVSSYWPWFLSPAAASGVKSGLPTRVYSCWNGLVAFRAAPFYADPPLRFRSVPDDLAHRHIEASERCLVHADNPLSAAQGVWLNPRVHVAPGGRYHAVQSRPDAAAAVHRHPGWAGALAGAWANRVVRWRGGAQAVLGAEAHVRSQFQSWLNETATATDTDRISGLPCLTDDMEVLGRDGWTHI
jgi:hypothetical protein